MILCSKPLKFAGLDYHQSRSSICVLDQGGNKVLTREVKGPWPAVVEALRQIKATVSASEPLAVCFEAGCGSGHLFDEFRQVADRVVVANPSQTRFTFRCKRKNDRIDAQKLALLLLIVRVPTVHVPSLSVREWRGMIMYRSRLVAKRTQVKNEVRSLLRNAGAIAPRRLWT